MAGTTGATAGNVADHLGVGYFSIVAEMRSCAASPALDTGVFPSPTGPLREVCGFGWFGLTKLSSTSAALLCSALLFGWGIENRREEWPEAKDDARDGMDAYQG